MTGIIRSMTRTLNSSSLSILAMASAPSRAVSTCRPARCTIFATRARIAGSSSTTNTRFVQGMRQKYMQKACGQWMRMVSAPLRGVTDEQGHRRRNPYGQQRPPQAGVHLQRLRIDAPAAARVAIVAVDGRLLRRLVEVRLARVGLGAVLLAQLAAAEEHVPVDDAGAEAL